MIILTWKAKYALWQWNSWVRAVFCRLSRGGRRERENWRYFLSLVCVTFKEAGKVSQHAGECLDRKMNHWKFFLSLLLLFCVWELYMRECYCVHAMVCAYVLVCMCNFWKSVFSFHHRFWGIKLGLLGFYGKPFTHWAVLLTWEGVERKGPQTEMAPDLGEPEMWGRWFGLRMVSN